MKKDGFQCCVCGQWVFFLNRIGTKHRNHCPFCLWSKHVDLKISGDRKAQCKAGMKPIGLTFKHEGRDKYGALKQGEIMLVHECLGCAKVSINRIAGDDNAEMILELFQESQELPLEKKRELVAGGINLLPGDKKKEIIAQLFGKSWASR